MLAGSNGHRKESQHWHTTPDMSVETLGGLFYPNYGDNWDDSVFRERVPSHLRPQHLVLDLGAGSGLVRQMNFRGLCQAVYGLDPDVGVLSNPHCDIAKMGAGESIPWADNTFDLIFADNVLEHLPEPEKVFVEVARVLKPGGLFLVKTPNRFHYVTIAAQLTPTFFHQFINKLRGRAESDTFPTRYRANSASSLRRLATGAGLNVVRVEHIEGRPEYMRISQLLYPLGVVRERAVNSVCMFRSLRVLLIATLQKI